MSKSIPRWFGSLEHETHERCPHCFSTMIQPISFKPIPSVLVFEIWAGRWNCSPRHQRINIPWRLPVYISYYWNWWYSIVMVLPPGAAMKMREILTCSLPDICWNVEGKFWSWQCMQEINWVGGWVVAVFCIYIRLFEWHVQILLFWSGKYYKNTNVSVGMSATVQNWHPCGNTNLFMPLLHKS
jgi:hypothetical protein